MILLVENILPIIKEITISQTNILHSQRSKFDYVEENNKRTKFGNQKS
jgi:hypothetical protein